MIQKRESILALLVLVVLSLSSMMAHSRAAAALDPIEFAPPHSHRAVDVDGDSLYEYLVLDVGVNVTEPGWYFVVGVLYSNDTRWTSAVWDSNFSLFDSGVNVSELRFSSYDICSYGLDGTYYAALELYNQDSVKIAVSNWTLGVYSIIDFDSGQPTRLEGPHGDSGLDTDADGQYNYLVIDVRVNVTEPGLYGICGSVSNLTNNITGEVRNRTYLEMGIQFVELKFNGQLFADAKADGPYLVWMDLMDYDFNRWFMSSSFTTGSYVWTQFSNLAASFSGPHSDASLDINGDGAKEYLAVYVNLSVSVSGYYNVSGTISVLYDTETVWNRPYLDAGYWNIPLLFSGETIRSSKYNGSFSVQMELYDGVGTWLWSNSYRTSSYLWTDFARPPVASAVAEQIIDGTNLNVTFNASTSLIDAEVYEVRWDFNGDGVWDTDWSNELTIVHQFPGPGNYVVLLEVRDVRGLTNQTRVNIAVNPPEVIRVPGDSRILLAAVLTVCLFVGATMLFYAWPIESLVVAVLALLIPLYSRLREDEILDNYRRGMIHGLILAHPGICFSDIRDTLSISNGSLVHHLGVLQNRGEVRCRKSGTLMRYFVNGTSTSQILKFGLTDFQSEIVKLVSSRGHVSTQDLRKALSASRQAIHYNLRKLEADNILASSFVGGHRLFRLAMGVDPRLIKALNEKDAEKSESRDLDPLATEDPTHSTFSEVPH